MGWYEDYLAEVAMQERGNMAVQARGELRPENQYALPPTDEATDEDKAAAEDRIGQNLRDFKAQVDRQRLLRSGQVAPRGWEEMEYLKGVRPIAASATAGKTLPNVPLSIPSQQTPTELLTERRTRADEILGLRPERTELNELGIVPQKTTPLPVQAPLVQEESVTSESSAMPLASSEGYIYTDPKTGRKVIKAWGTSGTSTNVPVEEYRAKMARDKVRILGKTPGTTASSMKDFEQFASQPPATLGEAMSKPQRQVGAMDEMSREMAAYDFWKNEPAPVVKSADVPWTETFVQTGDPAWESKERTAGQAWAIASARDNEKVQHMALPQYTEWFNSITDPYSGRPITDETMKTYMWELGKRYMPKSAKTDYERNKQDENVLKTAQRAAYWVKNAPSFMQSQGLEGYEPGTTPGTLKKAKPEDDTKRQAETQKATLAIGKAKADYEKKRQAYYDAMKKAKAEPGDPDLLDKQNDAMREMQYAQDILNTANEAYQGAVESQEAPQNLTMQQFLELFRKEQLRSPSQSEIQRAIAAGMVQAG